MNTLRDSSPPPASRRFMRTSVNRLSPYIGFFVYTPKDCKQESEVDRKRRNSGSSTGSTSETTSVSSDGHMSTSAFDGHDEVPYFNQSLVRCSVLSPEELMEKKKTKLNPYVGCFHYAPGRYSALHPLFVKAKLNPHIGGTEASTEETKSFDSEHLLYCDLDGNALYKISDFFAQRKVSQTITFDDDSEMLGMGSYACVLRAHFTATKKPIAIKYFNKLSESSSTQRGCAIQSALIKNEITILRKLRHRNVVQYLDCIEGAEKVYLIMELCNAGSLEDMVYLRRKMSEEECKGIFVQLCNALQYIHVRGIIHGDVKTMNIMFQVKDYNTDENHGKQVFRSPTGLNLKLCDFGSCRQCTLYNNDDPDDLSLKGTEGYLSPEQILNRKLTTAIDMWAAGVVLYRCFTGQLPYRPSAACLTSGPLQFSGPWWGSASDGCKQRVKSLLELDPSIRASASECLRDTWTMEDLFSYCML